MGKKKIYTQTRLTRCENMLPRSHGFCLPSPYRTKKREAFHQLSTGGIASRHCPATTRSNDLASTASTTNRSLACPRLPFYPACRSLRHRRAWSCEKERSVLNLGRGWNQNEWNGFICHCHPDSVSPWPVSSHVKIRTSCAHLVWCGFHEIFSLLSLRLCRTAWTASVQETQTTVLAVEEKFLSFSLDLCAALTKCLARLCTTCTFRLHHHKLLFVCHMQLQQNRCTGLPYKQRLRPFNVCK